MNNIELENELAEIARNYTDRVKSADEIRTVELMELGERAFPVGSPVWAARYYRGVVVRHLPLGLIEVELAGSPHNRQFHVQCLSIA